jgi:hypothetical protein
MVTLNTTDRVLFLVTSLVEEAQPAVTVSDDTLTSSDFQRQSTETDPDINLGYK